MLESGSTLPENHVQVKETSSSSDGGAIGYGLFQARKTTEKYGDYRNWNGVGGFEADVKTVDDEESGVCSPPLWRTSPPGSPQHNKNHYRSLSPSSRAQAIARGQKELMEMVSRMPEGCYELSLRDLVEQTMVEAEQESFSQKKSMINCENDYQRREQGKKKTDSKRVQLNRNGSTHSNGGPLLKMVFPISWGSNKKKKSNVSAMSNSVKDGRVSPKPLLSLDQEWWKKRYSDEGEESTESGRFSINSGSSKSTESSSSRSSSRNSTRYGNGGCCLPFRSHEKTA